MKLDKVELIVTDSSVIRPCQGPKRFGFGFLGCLVPLFIREIAEFMVIYLEL